MPYRYVYFLTRYIGVARLRHDCRLSVVCMWRMYCG